MQLAASRGHPVESVDAKPSLGNLLLWKVIYAHGNRHYVDAVRVALSSTIYPGESTAKLNLEKDFAWLEQGSRQYLDVARFSRFSDGFLSVHAENPDRIIDLRYSVLPNEIDALWMIELDRDKPVDAHVGFFHETARSNAKGRTLWNMILGR